MEDTMPKFFEHAPSLLGFGIGAMLVFYFLGCLFQAAANMAG